MADLFKISRWKSDTFKPNCCTQKTDHWCVTVGPGMLCECNLQITPYKSWYIYCNNKPSLYLCYNNVNGWCQSSHSLCSQQLIKKHRNAFIIDEIRELYNKLRLIEHELTTDCIRYIILAELGCRSRSATCVQRPGLITT